MDPFDPGDAQRIVAAFLKIVEAHAAEEVYPGRLRDLPYPKDTIRAAFRTSVTAVFAAGQMNAELREYLEIAYVSLADYVDEEFAALLREYVRSGEELTADRRPSRDKTSTDAWQRIAAQSRLAGEIARSISSDASQLRAEFLSWAPSSATDSVSPA
jgi:hypothetical protein